MEKCHNKNNFWFTAIRSCGTDLHTESLIDAFVVEG